MTTSDSPTCAHPTCFCAVEREGAFCSAYCENADHVTVAEEAPTDAEEAACACNHATCIEAQPGTAKGDDVVVAMGGGPGQHRSPSGD